MNNLIQEIRKLKLTIVEENENRIYFNCGKEYNNSYSVIWKKDRKSEDIFDLPYKNKFISKRFVRFLNVINQDYFSCIDKIEFILSRNNTSISNDDWKKRSVTTQTSEKSKIDGVYIKILLPTIKKMAMESGEDLVEKFNEIVYSTIFYELTHAVRNNPLNGFSESWRDEKAIKEEETWWLEDFQESFKQPYVVFNKKFIDSIE